MFTPEEIDVLTSSTRPKNPSVVLKDNVFEDIIEDVFTDVQKLRGSMRPAKMSGGADVSREDETVRGDSLCWVTPDICVQLQLSALDAVLSRIKTECDSMKTELGLTGDYNMQFAMYPGKGEGYNRHRDSFPTKPGAAAAAEPTRQLTCILYLNKDWSHEDGGQLRLFTLPDVVVAGAGEDEAFNFWGVNGYDIEPHIGRLIVFRSELVDHAVLPCRRERAAITIWLNGTGPPKGVAATPEMVFQFSPDAPAPSRTANTHSAAAGTAAGTATAAVDGGDDEEDDEDES